MSVGQTFEFHGQQARVRLVAADRVVVTLADDNLGTTAVLTLDRTAEQLLPRPADWRTLSRPVAGELRAGDVLPPPKNKRPPHRPNGHRFADEQVVTFQVVERVEAIPDDSRLRITTRDEFGQVRTYKYEPLEEVMFGPRHRYRKPRNERPPVTLDGPYVNSLGAQFIFQMRGQGGRQPMNVATFDDAREPRYHPVTGDIMPYIVIAPPKQQMSYIIRQPISAFSASALAEHPAQEVVRQRALKEGAATPLYAVPAAAPDAPPTTPGEEGQETETDE